MKNGLDLRVLGRLVPVSDPEKERKRTKNSEMKIPVTLPAESAKTRFKVESARTVRAIREGVSEAIPLIKECLGFTAFDSKSETQISLELMIRVTDDRTVLVEDVQLDSGEDRSKPSQPDERTVNPDAHKPRLDSELSPEVKACFIQILHTVEFDFDFDDALPGLYRTRYPFSFSKEENRK